MNDENLSKLKDAILKVRDTIVSWFKKALRIIGATLVVCGSAVALYALNQGGWGFAWIFVVPVFGVLFYWLAPRTPRLARIAKTLFPVVNELIGRQEQVSLNIAVVEKMGYTLRFYEVVNIDKNESLYNKLMNSLPQENNEDERIKNCARNVAEHLRPSHPYISGKLLELLYRERHASAKMIWEKERGQLAGDLARTLFQNQRLLKKQNEVVYGESELEKLLRTFEDYAFDKVEEQMDSVSAIYSCTNRYLDFLNHHDLAHQTALAGAATILSLASARLPLKPDAIDLTTFEVLNAIGEKAIHNACPELLGDLLSSFCLVSLSLFLTDRPKMMAMVCHKAAEKPEALHIIFAYLEFREDLRIEGRLDGKEFVSIHYLIQNWEARVAEKKKDLKGFEKEIRQITETLGKGEWVTSLSHLLGGMWERIQEDSRLIRDTHAQVMQWSFIQESLQRIFRTLSLTTVERFLETRKINAYLLTFRSYEGSVSHLLNSMISPEKWPIFDELQIALRVNGLIKYNFQQYTNNARIGVIPKGWTLEEFYRAFQEDFERVIQSRRTIVPLAEWNWNKSDLKDIELIIHRFGLSGRNYYGFDSKEFVRYYAIERIKELFSDILGSKDLLAVIGYEMNDENLLKAIMDGPITELIRDQLTEDERKVLEPQQETLRLAILAACGVGSAAELGHTLRLNPTLARSAKAKAAKKLFDLLAVRTLALPPSAPISVESGSLGKQQRSHPRRPPPPPAIQFDKDRCKMIAKAYIDTLIAIASIA